MTHSDQPVVGNRVQRRDLRALLRRLAKPVREQRMILAQEAADDERAIERADLGDRHAEPRNALRVPVAAKVRLPRSEEHTSELQSRPHLVCRLLLEKKKKK